MSWFTKLFSTGVSDVVTSVGNAIDNLVTSDEERMALKNELQKEMNGFATTQLTHAENMEQQITDRHANDMKSDSWLSKNVRPMTLIFLTATTILLAFTTIFSELKAGQLTALESWLPLLQTLLTSCYIFYFGGRSYEKAKGISGKNKTK